MSGEKNNAETLHSRLNLRLDVLSNLLSAIKSFITSNDCLIKLDHQCGSLMPVDSDFGWEATVG